ncbi:MAG: hypothetical protein ACXWTP_13785, partial [Methylosarcina sp.]
ASITANDYIPHWVIGLPMPLNGKWPHNYLSLCPKKLDHYTLWLKLDRKGYFAELLAVKKRPNTFRPF